MMGRDEAPPDGGFGNLQQEVTPAGGGGALRSCSYHKGRGRNNSVCNHFQKGLGDKESLEGTDFRKQIRNRNNNPTGWLGPHPFPQGIISKRSKFCSLRRQVILGRATAHGAAVMYSWWLLLDTGETHLAHIFNLTNRGHFPQW